MNIIDFTMPVEPFVMGSDISRYPVTRENRKKNVPVLNREGVYQGVIEPSVFSLMQARMVPSRDDVLFLYINREVPCIALEEWNPSILEAVFQIAPNEYRVLTLSKSVEWLSQNQSQASAELKEDVTENQQGFEEKLQEWLSVFHGSSEGFLLLDGEGKIIQVNPAYERFSGHEAEVLMERKIQDLVQEGYYKKSVALEALEQKESKSIIQEKENQRWVLVTGSPIFDTQGNLFRILTTVKDITQFYPFSGEGKTEELPATAIESAEPKESKFHSEKMRNLYQAIQKVASVSSTLLLIGESGCVPEGIAQEIHKKGGKSAESFIKINCAGIPENLLEAELFGTVGKPGAFERSAQGTLFLEGIEHLADSSQLKLLRILEDRQFIRGGTQRVFVESRVIASTSSDLKELVDQGEFREDLYYKLSVIPLEIPPLRDRKEEIPFLALQLVEELSAQLGQKKTIAPEVIEEFVHYEWPGNLRELSNVVEQMVVMVDGEKIGLEVLPSRIRSQFFMPHKGLKMKEAVGQTEAYMIRETYKECQSWTKTAEILGMDRVSIYRKAKKHGISVNE